MDYYTNLLQSSASFGEALAWTVIRPLQEPLSLQSAASRLIGGGHPPIVDADEEFIEEVESLNGRAVYIGQSGDATMLLEPDGFSYAAGSHVMAWLSQEAQVWHLSWNHTGRRVLEYAANGQWLAGIAELNPHAIYGADPAALQAEAAAMEEVVNAPWPTQQATALAIIELRTGAQLPRDWFDQPRQVAIVEPLISKDCPPIGLWHYEPDLDARLRLAPQESRSAVLLQLVDVLTNRFHLDMPATTRARQAAHSGLPLDADLLEDVGAEWESLGHQWADRGFAVREENDDAWRRWVAANAVRHSLQSLSEGSTYLDALTYGKFALDEEWPDNRTWIREIISRIP
ncbi:hypothetical protein [Nonomuraea basaltis]|uniref:hypothetical protein n=1 Tax=Nonomuraea basaltis TaxID=2495887 RepID=UPI00110C429E|nr:hypothetical protein [Nonomuraea basaltis]TMR90779.1 hypothetical protein EJK15_53420 [Nonomuraea basaltis]